MREAMRRISGNHKLPLFPNGSMRNPFHSGEHFNEKALTLYINRRLIGIVEHLIEIYEYVTRHSVPSSILAYLISFAASSTRPTVCSDGSFSLNVMRQIDPIQMRTKIICGTNSLFLRPFRTRFGQRRNDLRRFIFNFDRVRKHDVAELCPRLVLLLGPVHSAVHQLLLREPSV